MKKIICLLMCLILLISCVPAAMAASLTPEKVTGTWELTKMCYDGETADAAALKKVGYGMTLQFHADGTGKYAEGWTSRVETDRLSATGTIYTGKLPGLPHLLEHGHAKRGGGRVPGRVHIAPVEKILESAFMRAIQTKL